MSTVLVTGGTGFVGSHALVRLLNDGHQVRTTLRDLARKDEVLSLLNAANVKHDGRLSFFKADLANDEGWGDAISGCDFVLHIASPFPPGAVNHEDELIIPARDGALRVLRASRDAGVRRVVMTSSFAAIGYGYKSQKQAFDETSWSNLNAGLEPYIKSKTVAERAAWDFMSKEGGSLELTVINPTGIFGPTLGNHLSGSLVLIQSLIKGAMPACPQFYFGVVDVRDVVDAHVRAMVHPQAAGQRFIATSSTYSLVEVARILKRLMGSAPNKIPTREIPNWFMKLFSFIKPEIRKSLPDLGVLRPSSNKKIEQMLQWSPRPVEETFLATIESLKKVGAI